MGIILNISNGQFLHFGAMLGSLPQIEFKSFQLFGKLSYFLHINIFLWVSMLH